ncbi:MAG: rhodanese-like domain-containing protein [Gammaproteobacteria bacterium]
MRLSLTLIPFLFALLLSAPAFGADKDTGWRSPEHLDGATTIDTAQAAALHAQGVVFIDARSSRLYTKRHIPGAIHLDLKSALTEANMQAVVGKNDPVILYGNGVHCSRGYKAVNKALEFGYTQVYYYRVGFRSWRKAGHPITRGSNP